MIKISKIFCYLFLVMFCSITNVRAFPVPTFSIPEIAQAVTTHISTATSTASEITSTKDLIKKGVLAGVPGYLQAIQDGNFKGLAKDFAGDAYDIYNADQKNKKKAKEAAQEQAEKEAKEKLEAQQEGTAAAEAAVEQNREKAEETKETGIKKLFSWGKRTGSNVADWGENRGTALGNWLNKGKNQQDVNKIIHGALGDSQASSAMMKATDKLAEQAKNKEENAGD